MLAQVTQDAIMYDDWDDVGQYPRNLYILVVSGSSVVSPEFME